MASVLLYEIIHSHRSNCPHYGGRISFLYCHWHSLAEVEVWFLFSCKWPDPATKLLKKALSVWAKGSCGFHCHWGELEWSIQMVILLNLPLYSLYSYRTHCDNYNRAVGSWVHAFWSHWQCPWSEYKYDPSERTIAHLLYIDCSPTIFR